MRPTYQQCLDMGMTATETATARGVSAQSAASWAKYHGKQFHVAPVKRLEDRSRYCIFHSMTLDERNNYRIFRDARYTRSESLEAIGRADLDVSRGETQ